MTYDEGFAAGVRRAADHVRQETSRWLTLEERAGIGKAAGEYLDALADEIDAILAAIPTPAPWTPPSVRTWSHYPIAIPVTADGNGPATIGFDAVSVEYEVWEAEPPHHTVASFDNLPDAINEAIRLSFAPLPPAPEDAP